MICSIRILTGTLTILRWLALGGSQQVDPTLLAVGPIVDASDEEIVYAIKRYAVLRHTLHMTPSAFGSWAGTSTSPGSRP